MKTVNVEVSDKKFKKLFDIDPEFYSKSAFLRDIRYQYGIYHNLTEKQVSAFKKVVDELKNPKKKEQQDVGPKAPKKDELPRARTMYNRERSVLRAIRTK